jgi:hypothetical protein
MTFDNKALDEQAVRFEQQGILLSKNAIETLNREQMLILIGEEMLQNIIGLVNNFIKLLNGIFADCGTVVNGDENKQSLSDEVFGQVLGNREIQNIWDKDFGRNNKSGRVCNDYGVMLQDKDILKDYSGLFQKMYKTKDYKSSPGYNSNQLLEGLQYFRQTQENLLKMPGALKGYEISRTPSGSNSHGSSFVRLKDLYFNPQANKADIKGGDLYKSLDAYFNN